jgi:aldose 1-epimerase
MARFGVAEAEDVAAGKVGWRLHDRQTGAEARIAPAQGANLVGLRLAARGQAHELLTPVPTEAQPRHGYGAPVLFPYPNRVRDARYTWQGREHRLPATPSGHAIHGLVRDRAFAVEQATADEGGARLRCVLRAADCPDLAAYPFAFGLALTYTLSAGGLRTQAEVWNEGAEPLPFGIGFHPYFRAPLAADGRRADCRLLLWGPRVWELDGETLPTGRVLSAPPALDARGYPALGGSVFDTLYTGLALDDPGAATWSGRYLDPAAGLEVVVTADQAFREAVLFAPTARPVVSIEPYTCATDALNLQARGIDAGLLRLAPGERWSAGYTIALRAITFAA